MADNAPDDKLDRAITRAAYLARSGLAQTRGKPVPTQEAILAMYRLGPFPPKTRSRPSASPSPLVARLSIGMAWLVGLVIVQIPNTSRAQVTLQLPTVRVFNVRTVVMVPDGGTMHLGGINRSSVGRTTRSVPFLGHVPMVNRLFKNTGIGGTTEATGTSVRAQIIIMEEVEAEVMKEAQRRLAERQRRREAIDGTPEQQRQADFITRNIGRNRKR